MVETTAVRPYPVQQRATGCPFDPPPVLGELRRDQPISRVRIWDGSEPWLVTRYDDIRAVLSHPAASHDSDNPGYPNQSAAIAARRSRAKTFFQMDGPAHDEPRRMLARDFTAKRMLALRGRIQDLVDGLIDDMLAGPKPVDLVQAFALPVPTTIICELLGVPHAEHGRVHRLTEVFVAKSATPEQTTAAAEEMLGLFGDLVEVKASAPSDDLLSRLAVEQFATGLMTREEVSRMGLLLVTAGHESTASMIALGTAALLANPEQLAKIRETDDPALVASTVEEMLRYLTIVHNGLRRVATEDMEIGGRRIAKGEGIIVAIDAGNRDAEAFPGEGDLGVDSVDITRAARHHLAFGFGVHQCLGQQLARVELQVVYGTLFKRIPTLRLAQPLDEIKYKSDMAIYGAHELLVTW
ncbi:cytochrome P450 [Prescottella equi]|uniref:cytochrome P450 n=1 Tax=Rhodococcus hoagii TaxID=43767 RepID=UPI0038517D71